MGKTPPIVLHVAGHDAFVHEAFLSESEDDYAAGAVPFIVDGIEAAGPVMVVPRRRIDLLRSALGGTHATPPSPPDPPGRCSAPTTPPPRGPT